MERLKVFIANNFESVFVLSLIVSIGVINFFIIQKLAFLNFYFLPVIISGYHLGRQRTILSAVLCIVFIFLDFVLFPEHFEVSTKKWEIIVYLVAWASFLIIAGAVVSGLQEKLQQEMLTTRQLNKDLSEKQEELRQSNLSLKEHSENLEIKVKSRTSELEQSRNLLETMKRKVEDALYSTMDAAVAKLIIEGRLRDEKRSISVMFTDLTGFTAYSESRQPELVTKDLNRYFSEMEQILFAYNAHIDKYQGDGIMCEFGTPLDFVHYRLMAVVCALKMQERMAAQNYPWKMRIGIASGMAIVGLIGARRQSYTTIGDVVNLASRFEKECPSGSILIDSHTMEGVRQFVDVKLKHDVDISDSMTARVRMQLLEVADQLSAADSRSAKADLHHQAGQLHLAIMETDEAVCNFEKALQLQPDDANLKIAFAEAMLQKDHLCKIQVKGKSKRVAAYEVTGLKDALLDRKKLPEAFHARYRHAVALIDIPEDVILPSEVLDGCIGHGKTVALLAYAVAAELGIESEQTKKDILQAAFLADIGLEAVPRHLLNRSKGGLTSAEYQEFLRHSVEGTRIMKKNGYQDSHLLEMVYHSHEKYDGSGFPAGLRGKGIPVGARIIAVADTYDTLTSWHPCRERWDMKAAFDELRRCVEKGYLDAEIVQALLHVLGEG